MFVQVSVVPSECSPPEYNAIAHLCPYCDRVGSGCIHGIENDDIHTSYVAFLCDDCGAILFLKMDHSYDGCVWEDVEPYIVTRETIDPCIVQATNLQDQQSVLWLAIPVWKIKCSRMCGRGWEPKVERFSENYVVVDEDEDDYIPDADPMYAPYKTIQWCNSYSLSHPETPYLHPRVVPDRLGDMVVHVLLENDEVAEFGGSGDYGAPRWARACRARIGVCDGNRIDSDSDSDD